MKISENFLNALISANILSMKNIARSLNFFSEIMITEHDVCNHDFRKEIKY